jgi:TonB family protein
MSKFMWIGLLMVFAAPSTVLPASDKGTGPAMIFKPRIPYPYAARDKRMEGRGVVELQLNRRTGVVRSARMLRSTGFRLLDDAAVSAFLKARFRPGTSSPVKVPINFTMGRR